MPGGHFIRHPKQVPGPNRSHVMSLKTARLSNAEIGRRLGITKVRVGQIVDLEIHERLLRGEHWKDLKEKYHLTDKQMERIRSGKGYSQERSVERNRKELKEKNNG